MQDGPYNDVWNWRYDRLPDVLGAGRGFLVRTDEELVHALKEAKAHTGSFCLLEIQLGQSDRSPALQRLAERLGRNI